MRTTALVCMAFVVLLPAPFEAAGQPTIQVFTDQDAYQFDDTIEVSLSAENNSEGMSVAAYVGIILPDATIWSVQYDGWAESIEAWIPEIYVPAWFEMTRTPFWTFDLPCESPPIDACGDYCFAAVLTYPGTFDWVSIAGLAPFSYVSSGPSTDITMLSIPAGSFLMGSPSSETGRLPDEGPRRTVNISAFMLSRTEVTEKQWETVMGWNDCFVSRGDDYPVEGVTWLDCVSFCNKLSEADGYEKCYTITNVGYDGSHITSADISRDFTANGYRLPTEAEWEYACRAGTTTRFYTGSPDSVLDQAGWFGENSASQKHEVAQKQANSFGLFDTHGNNCEWCWDWHAEDYYGTRPDPDTDPTGPDTGQYRILRGGCWWSPAEHCRSAWRDMHYPYFRDSSNDLRVCRSCD